MTGAPPRSYRQLGRGLPRLHVAVWEQAHGPVPAGYLVDHRDGNIHNNALDNLRLATRSQNAQNMRRPQSNTTGLKGLSWDGARQQWRGSVSAAGKQRSTRGELLDVCAWLFSMRRSLHGEYARH